jgi:hypothetical protein
MIPRPPIQPVTELELLDYAQRLTLWLTDAYNLLREYEQRKTVRRTAVDYTTSADDRNVAVTDTAAPRTVTVASAAIAKDGFELTVSDESGNAAVNNITVATEGAETINGAASVAIASNYGAVRLRSNGSNLFTIT